MVNYSGTSFDHRMTEETGASSADVLRAWVAGRDIFELPRLWDEIEVASTGLPFAEQVSMFLDARRMVERGVMWLLRRRRPPLDIGDHGRRVRPGGAAGSSTRSARSCAARSPSRSHATAAARRSSSACPPTGSRRVRRSGP